MSESSSDGQRVPGRSPIFGASAALFEYAKRPIAAVQGPEDLHIDVVNRAYLARFEGRCPDDGGGPVRHRRELTEAERDLVTRAADGTPVEDVVSRTTPEGCRSFAVRAIPADGADLAAFLQYRQVTAERIRDQQLAVLRRVLRHDLRNDLTVLLGYAETIADTADDPGTREQAATMVDAAGDLRSVATAAGRMQCVTAEAEATSLGDAVAKARRAIAADGAIGDDAWELSIEGRVPARSVDRRVAVALEELFRTIVKHANATEIGCSVASADGWATITIEADAAIDEQERAALEGRDETKLRHATGLAPWIARWAVRAAGGRLSVEDADDAATLVVAAPVHDAVHAPRSGASARTVPSFQSDD